MTTDNKETHAMELIAKEYALATQNLTDALRHYHRCGELLNDQKKTLPRGQWMSWLRDNKKTLGFGDRTAQRMMVFGKSTLASILADQSALTLSRKLWCHTTKTKTEEPNASTNGTKPVKKADPAKTANQRIGYAQKHGIPELMTAIKAGEITPWIARNIAHKPKEMQKTWLQAERIPAGPPDTSQMIWRRGITNRAAEAMGHAIYEDWEMFTVDKKLIEICMSVAEAWETLAAYLQTLLDKQRREVKEK